MRTSANAERLVYEDLTDSVSQERCPGDSQTGGVRVETVNGVTLNYIPCVEEALAMSPLRFQYREQIHPFDRTCNAWRVELCVGVLFSCVVYARDDCVRISWIEI